MNNQELFISKLDRWQNYMEHYSLPDWDHLPDMALYIDQVVAMVTKYLDLIPHSEKDPIVTPSIINNYVRLKAMPAPVKKRYSRQHLAYAVMICAMKQSMTLTEIQKILPGELDEDQTRRVYNAFVERMTQTARVFIDQVNAVAARELVPDNDHGCNDLILHSAVSALLYKILTVKLTRLEEKP